MIPRTARLTLTAAIALLATPLLASCTTDSADQPTPSPTAPGDPTPQPPDGDAIGILPTSPEDTLRFFVPDGFQIGTAAAGGGHHQAQPYPDPFSSDEPYREQLAAEFTSLSPENQLKWEYLRPSQDTFDFSAADAIVDFAEANGQQVRGHTLLWHSQNPGWLESGSFTEDELREILREHIQTVVGRYAGRIHQWDVANEIFNDSAALRTSDNIWIRELGPEIIADAFRWAHEADPDALLFLNDYSIDGINAKSNAYYQLAQDLLAEGVPLHGMGIQGHLSTQYGFPGDVQGNLQRFADLGLETAVTELDVRIVLGSSDEPSEADLAQQADYYGRMLAACLAVEGCNSFTLWGFTDTYSWVPHFFPREGAALVMWEDYSRKPSYCAVQEGLAQASGMTDTPAFTGRGCAALD